MPKKPQQLAKLSRPRLYDALPRERLFALLDEKRKHPAVWIAAPPGSGKTTLVAGYVESRKLPCLWYQVDSGDSDPATFFYYLGLAERALPGRRPRIGLPLLTPEYLSDLPSFARRYFRQLFVRLGTSGILVFDNFQELSPASMVHKVIAAAIEEASGECSIVLLSRLEPEQDYIRNAANQSLARVHWQQFKLTEAEATSLLKAQLDIDAAAARKIHQQSDGWAAGLRLLAEWVHRGGSIEQIGKPESLRDIFEYFAGELFSSASPADQHSLMQLSFLPRMSASAVYKLAGNQNAIALLEDMHRRHLFTSRHQAGEPVYQFHSLLRAFLQGRANQSLDSLRRIALTSRAACILDEAGQTEDALPLFVEAGEYARARTVILRESASFIRQGRWNTIIEWIEALPPILMQRDCWLTYWLGAATMFSHPGRARELLERSFDLAEQDSDRLCRLLTAAGVINTYMAEYGEYRPLDRWIEIIESEFNNLLGLENPEHRLHIQSAMLVALAFRQPSNPRLPIFVARVFELLDSDIDVNLRLLAVTALVRYGSTSGPLDVGRRALMHMEPLLGSKGATAFNVASALAATSWLHCLMRNSAACLEASLRAERISEEHGLIPPAKVALINRMWLRLFELDSPGSSELLAKLAPMLNHANPFDIATLYGAKAWIALGENRPKEAWDFMIEAVGVFDRVGSTMHQVNFRLGLITILVVNGRCDSARLEILKVRELAGAGITSWQCNALVALDAAIALEEGDAGLSFEKFQTAIGQARASEDNFSFANWCGPWMPRLFQMMVAAGIEVPYVKELIRRYNVSQPPPGLADWPWPVKILTLGGFRVEVDGKTLSFTRKAPRKVLALLKALIAFGGSGVPERRLMDALWPDESGDSAHESLSVNLHRLRKLLGHTDVIRLSDGLIDLDPGKCWTDVGAFEHRFSRFSEGNGLEAEENADSLLHLYRGHFLPEEFDTPWAVSMRERLRSQFLNYLSRVARQHENAERLENAILLYRKGIESDDLAEELYQGLMRCHMKQERRAEAMAVYRRLRQVLSVTLGIQPSPQSEKLFRLLQSP